MKFDLQRMPEAFADIGPQIGDVYRMKGGRQGGGFWIIVAQTEKMSVCLGLGAEGEVVSCTTYYTDVMDRRARVGYVPGVADLTFDILWG